ncbi:hypothetical protein PGT21_011590 [Puccinia graminis f. sp. tritici]|uniref:Uncharacterized protein n=1 Tax=Puccinia graminis f. sp. tritici TaxID=56615 RepID=A0A5B0MEJ7_PUCGR|nr:hypothetical protein PGT21_011590 [Puccinia graminis f. sp. tritici]
MIRRIPTLQPINKQPAIIYSGYLYLLVIGTASLTLLAIRTASSSSEQLPFFRKASLLTIQPPQPELNLEAKLNHS